jgi:hypothetical protein
LIIPILRRLLWAVGGDLIEHAQHIELADQITEYDCAVAGASGLLLVCVYAPDTLTAQPTHQRPRWLVDGATNQRCALSSQCFASSPSK